MAITKYLAATAAAVATVSATVCSIDASSTTTMTAATAVSAVIQCSTFSGNIALSTGVSSGGVLSLDGIQEVTGELSYIGDHNVTSISASQLEKTGSLVLGDLPVLSSLTMGALNEVTDTLNFTGLGTIQTLTFGTPGVETVGDLIIVNTHLINLVGLDKISKIKSYTVNSNPLLANIELDVKTIDSLMIGANDVAQNGLSTSFPNLQTASNITIQNATVVSLPALINTTGTLGLYGNDFKSFSAPNLTSTGGLVFNNNNEMTNLSMPKLTTLSGTDSPFVIANNTKLETIDGFPKLQSVSGGVTVEGVFTNFSLPALANVQGAMNVQTSEDFDCTPIYNYASDQVVQGAVSCNSSDSSAAASGTTGGTLATNTGSGSTASSTSSSGKSAAGALSVDSSLVFCGVSLAAIILALF
ncbi:hypothetical protein MMC25_002088 [Agyrium rufum]|nr:hypothetical protein [Agyrium rufum]